MGVIGCSTSLTYSSIPCQTLEVVGCLLKTYAHDRLPTFEPPYVDFMREGQPWQLLLAGNSLLSTLNASHEERDAKIDPLVNRILDHARNLSEGNNLVWRYGYEAFGTRLFRREVTIEKEEGVSYALSFGDEDDAQFVKRHQSPLISIGLKSATLLFKLTPPQSETYEIDFEECLGLLGGIEVFQLLDRESIAKRFVDLQPFFNGFKFFHDLNNHVGGYMRLTQADRFPDGENEGQGRYKRDRAKLIVKSRLTDNGDKFATPELDIYFFSRARSKEASKVFMLELFGIIEEVLRGRNLL